MGDGGMLAAVFCFGVGAVVGGGERGGVGVVGMGGGEGIGVVDSMGLGSERPANTTGEPATIITTRIPISNTTIAVNTTTTGSRAVIRLFYVYDI